jgi:putative spermidine/putrescine transport system substrate-binding protein
MISPREDAPHQPIGRRRFVQTAATGLAVGVGVLRGSRLARAKPAQMVIVSGGGALEEAFMKAYYQPWTAKTGIKIVTGPNATAKLKAMVEARAVEWDVAQIAAEVAAPLARQGLLEPLDYSLIDKSKLLPGVAHEHFLMCDVAAYIVAWNTKAVKGDRAPRTWAEFWDTQARPGRRGLWKRPFQTMEVALMADGVDKDRLYPLDVERALRSLAKIKPQIYWWDRGAQSAQILIDGEVEISATWNGRVHQPKADGAPVDFHFNQSLFVSDSWVVPRGAPNKRESMEFIASTLQAEAQAAFSRAIPYGPVNPAALKLLDAKTLDTLPSSEANFKRGAFLDPFWWADNGAKTQERFDQWLLA